MLNQLTDMAGGEGAKKKAASDATKDALIAASNALMEQKIKNTI